jgi:gentisate 1,2-dioxygenase
LFSTLNNEKVFRQTLRICQPLSATVERNRTLAPVKGTQYLFVAVRAAGEKFQWQKGDTFIVPLWSWHEHANASATDEAILFSMHDEPILKAFGLYREEPQDRNES